MSFSGRRLAIQIALIHYSAQPVVGGVESVLSSHAKLMVSAGDQVRIIAGRGSVFDRRIQFLPVPIIDSIHSRIIDAKVHLDKGLIPENFKQLVKDVKNRLQPALNNVDLIIAHNVCSLHKNLALTVALHELSQLPSSHKMILWHHDLAWTSPRYRGELYDQYPWNLLRTPWSGVQQVAVSETRRLQLAKLLKIPDKQVTVVPNGIDIAAFLGFGIETRKLVEHFDLLSGYPLLLMPVRVTSRKNIEHALLGIAELRKRLPNVRLIITGPLGPHNPSNQTYFESLHALRSRLGLETSVIFLAEYLDTYLPDSVISDFYQLADGLLMTSQDEGFGIPILEAGLAGIPIFCSDIPAFRALAGLNASFFNPFGNPRELADRIVKCLQENSVYLHRVEVRQKYSWENIYSNQIAPLLELYR